MGLRGLVPWHQFDGCWSVVQIQNSWDWPLNTSAIQPPSFSSLSPQRPLSSLLQSAAWITQLLSSLPILLLSHTTSTLPQPLESFFIIKGKNTDLKGRQKENCTCPWDPMRNVADWKGRGKAGFWNGEKLVSWTRWKPSPGQGWWREAGGGIRAAAQPGKEKKEKEPPAWNAHVYIQDPGSCTPWESSAKDQEERKELKSNSTVCGRRAG